MYLSNKWLEVANDLTEMNPNLGFYLSPIIQSRCSYGVVGNFFGLSANQLPIAGPED